MNRKAKFSKAEYPAYCTAVSRPVCSSAACGTIDRGDSTWHCIANVYNSTDILAYVDGEIDNHGGIEDLRNPFKCVAAIFVSWWFEAALDIHQGDVALNLVDLARALHIFF